MPACIVKLQSHWSGWALIFSQSYPDGTRVSCTSQELYLNAADFQEAFGMDLQAFQKMPKWRRDQAKKKAKLY